MKILGAFKFVVAFIAAAVLAIAVVIVLVLFYEIPLKKEKE